MRSARSSGFIYVVPHWSPMRVATPKARLISAFVAIASDTRFRIVIFKHRYWQITVALLAAFISSRLQSFLYFTHCFDRLHDDIVRPSAITHSLQSFTKQSIEGAYRIFANIETIQPNHRHSESLWPAPGSADTELGVFMEPEVSHGKAKVYTG